MTKILKLIRFLLEYDYFNKRKIMFTTTIKSKNLVANSYKIDFDSRNVCNDAKRMSNLIFFLRS